LFRKVLAIRKTKAPDDASSIHVRTRESRETQSPPNFPTGSPTNRTLQLSAVGEPILRLKARNEAESAPQRDIPSLSPLEPNSTGERTLREAAENLKKELQKSGMDSSGFEFELIHGSYDMNTLAYNLERCLGAIMDNSNVSLSNQNAVKTFVKEWAKKSIPFIEKGLTAAEVHICANGRFLAEK
jgi:hypothetical protein